MTKKNSAIQWPGLVRFLQHITEVVIKSYIFISRSRPKILFEGWQEQTNYIVVANHIKPIDPFVAGCSFKHRDFRHLFPYRFIAANKLLRKPHYWLFMVPFGSFPAHEHPRRTHGIEASKEVIKSGQTLVIFPEGKMNRSRTPAKIGIEILAKEARVRLIPVYLEGKRFGYRTVIGQSFDGSKLKAEQILDKVYDLKQHLK